VPGDVPRRAAEEERERRRAVRAYVSRNHPDVGGDPADFTAGLAALRAELQLGARATTRTGPARVIVVRSRGPRAWLRRLLGPRPAERRRPLR
jgi:hypothetical protein